MKKILLDMMEKLINDKYDCNEFSFDFPNEMFGEDDRKALTQFGLVSFS